MTKPKTKHTKPAKPKRSCVVVVYLTPAPSQDTVKKLSKAIEKAAEAINCFPGPTHEPTPNCYAGTQTKAKKK